MQLLNANRTTFIFMIASFLAVSACSSLPQHQQPATAANEEVRGALLNSERIRQKFGSYGIDVIAESDHQRVSNLYSLQGDRKITRTFAVVSYPTIIPAAIRNEHEQIKNGHSIGAVFKRNGWQIEKQHIYFGEIEASPDYEGIYSSMGEAEEVDLAIHIYQLSAIKGGERYGYVEIAEIHHPDYLNTRVLRQIYPTVLMEAESNQQSVQSSLDEVLRVMASVGSE